MLPDLRHQVGVAVILLILLTGLPLRPVKAGDDLPYDRTPFAGFPETVAVEEMLRQEQAFDILRSTSQVATDTSGDFGTATVVYSQAGREEQLKVFLLKEGEAWQAYQDIPAHKDHPGVFFLLARGTAHKNSGKPWE